MSINDEMRKYIYNVNIISVGTEISITQGLFIFGAIDNFIVIFFVKLPHC